MIARRILFVASGAGGFLALLLWAALRAPDNDRSTRVATTYSSGDAGAKALYLLFEQSGLPVSRLRRLESSALGPERANTTELALWILVPAPLPDADADSVLAFVTTGGTVVAPPELAADLLVRAGLSRAKVAGTSCATARCRLRTRQGVKLAGRPLSLRQIIGVRPDAVDVWLAGHAPGPPPAGGDDASAGTPMEGNALVARYALSAGWVVSVGILDALRNEHIGDDDGSAAVFWPRLAASLAQHHAFDELHTGYGDINIITLLWQSRYRWAVVELGLVLLLGGWAMAGRAQPAEPAAAVRRRETRDHVQGVAAWWARSGHVELPVTALLASLETRAARRALGVDDARSAGGAGAEPRRGRHFVAWAAAVRPELGQRAARAWQSAEHLLAQDKAPARELVGVAAELRAIEREVFPC